MSYDKLKPSIGIRQRSKCWWVYVQLCNRLRKRRHAQSYTLSQYQMCWHRLSSLLADTMDCLPLFIYPLASFPCVCQLGTATPIGHRAAMFSAPVEFPPETAHYQNFDVCWEILVGRLAFLPWLMNLSNHVSWKTTIMWVAVYTFYDFLNVHFSGYPLMLAVTVYMSPRRCNPSVVMNGKHMQHYTYMWVIYLNFCVMCWLKVYSHLILLARW